MGWRCHCCGEWFELEDDEKPEVVHPPGPPDDPDAGTLLTLCSECAEVIEAAVDAGLTSALLARHEEYLADCRRDAEWKQRREDASPVIAWAIRYEELVYNDIAVDDSHEVEPVVTCLQAKTEEEVRDRLRDLWTECHAGDPDIALGKVLSCHPASQEDAEQFALLSIAGARRREAVPS